MTTFEFECAKTLGMTIGLILAAILPEDQRKELELAIEAKLEELKSGNQGPEVSS